MTGKIVRYRRLRSYAVAMTLAALLSGCNGPFDADVETKGQNITPQMRDDWYTAASGQPKMPPTDIQKELIEQPVTGFEHELTEMPEYAQDDSMYGFSPESAGKKPPVANLDETVQADFNFALAAMTDVLPVFSKLLGANYVVEGALPGSVTMSVHASMTRREILELFEQLLRFSGIAVRYEDNLIHLRAVTTIPQELNLDNVSGDLEIGVFRFKHISANGITAQLSKFIGREAKTIEMPTQNTLLVLDTRDTMSRLRLLLTELDRPARRDWCKKIIPCRNVPADQMVKELAEVLPVLGFPVAVNTATPPEGSLHLVGLERLQVIVASSANAEALEELDRWMALLDQTELGDQEQMFVYDIYNATSDELVKALAVMFPVVGSSITPTTSGGVTENPNLATPGTVQSQEESAPGSVFDTPVRVFSDGVQNRLVIRTKPRTYAMVKALLERLDTIPSQVLLQVLVIEVSLSDSVAFGVEFMTQNSIGGWDSSTGIDYRPLDPEAANNYGFKYWLFDPDNPDQKFAYINALAAQTNVKVISKPQLRVISNKEANIEVGNEVPILQGDISDTDSTTTKRIVKYRDTGVNLKVTPQVTRGGRISLKLRQEISEAIPNTSSTIDSPEIQKRILETMMNIRDGQTVICGGIIRDRSTDNLDTVPIIGQIPFLRRLLGDTNVSIDRTELLILISGSIITEDTPLQTMLKGFEQSVDSLIEFEEGPNARKTRQFKHSGSLESWFFE